MSPAICSFHQSLSLIAVLSSPFLLYLLSLISPISETPLILTSKHKWNCFSFLPPTVVCALLPLCFPCLIQGPTPNGIDPPPSVVLPVSHVSPAFWVPVSMWFHCFGFTSVLTYFKINLPPQQTSKLDWVMSSKELIVRRCRGRKKNIWEE